MRLFLLALSLASFLGLAHAHDFEAGQVWAYKTRAGEAGSTLLIDKVETDATLGKIFHVSVSGVHVKNPRAASGFTTELPHFPVSSRTLKQSCLEIVGHAPPNPAYLNGYAAWKKAFDDGHAGVFSIPVAEVIDTMESAINQ